MRLNIFGDLFILSGEFFFLVLNFLSEFFFNLDRSLINRTTRINAFLSFMLKFVGELVFNIFDLSVDIGDLLVDIGSFRGDDGISDLLRLNLLLDDIDSLISFLGDSFGCLFLKLGGVDLSSLFVDHSLLGLLVDDFGCFLIQGLFLGLLLVIDVC
jgi:hypothetical protein